MADLFCGCGGLTLGVHIAAREAEIPLEVAYAIDTSETAMSVYRNNFGSIIIRSDLADINEILDGELGSPLTQNERSLQGEMSQIDLVVAGPPCQGHSDLNNKTRRKDQRNALYLKVVRFCEITLPNTIIIENVPAVVHDTNRNLERAILAFEGLGYNVETAVVNFLSLHLPQKRRRHVLLATRSALKMPDSMLKVPNKTKTVRDAISDLLCIDKDEIYETASTMSPANRKRAEYLFDNDLYDLPDSLRPFCHREKEHTYRSVYGRLHWDQPAPTITSGFGSMGQGRFLHPSARRVLTPHEAARIQGFPDTFSFAGIARRGALQEMIGNAVPPQLTQAIVAEFLGNGLTRASGMRGLDGYGSSQ